MARKLTLTRMLVSGGLLVVVLLLEFGICYAQDPFPVQIPRIMQSLDFGISAGSGLYPARIAVDGVHQRVYLFNNGDNREGNTISVFDLTMNRFVALIALHNPGEYAPPTPIDIKVDPYRPLLYAITGNPYAETTESEMFVIDINTLSVVKRVPDVEAVEPGPKALYLVNDVQLWMWIRNSLSSKERQRSLIVDTTRPCFLIRHLSASTCCALIPPSWLCSILRFWIL